MKKIEVVIFDENRKLRYNMALTTKKDIQIENEQDRYAKVRSVVASHIAGKTAAVTWRHDGIPEGFMVIQ